MQRNSVLKVMNPVLGLVVLTQLLTGLFHDLLPKAVFQTLHKGGGIIVAAAVILHIVLNWNWIKASYFRSRPKTTP